METILIWLSTEIITSCDSVRCMSDSNPCARPVLHWTGNWKFFQNTGDSKDQGYYNICRKIYYFSLETECVC